MAKKKSRKKPAPPGVDPNERRRERLEARRQAKAEAVQAQLRKQRREKIVRRIVTLGLVLGLVWFLFLRGAAPTEIEGHPVQTFSSAGLQQHQDTPVSYPDSPPVSGAHAPSPAGCGVYGDPIPNENMVHTLEHGGVGLLYKADLELDDIRALEAIVGDYPSHVFSAPYEGEMKTPIAIASWSRRMDLDTLDESAVRKYIDAFRDKGPEAGQECDPDQDDPFEPAASPSPTGSPPAPSISPEPAPSPSS